MHSMKALLLALSTISVLTTRADAQSSMLDDLRSEIHERLQAGHTALSYRATRAALASIHEDSDQPGNILLFYTGRSQSEADWVSTDPQDGWNREHLWPQSRGTRGLPMKSDVHHLVPTDASVNSRRGNLNFDNATTPEGEAPDTFLSADSFEPRDDVKGDVARAIFYMDVRYEGTNGEPDLTLVDDLTSAGSTSLGDLCTLIDWHLADPVSDDEETRNDLAQLEQGNRNVFIDEPELAEALFGTACGLEVPEIVKTEENDQIRIGTWNIANLHHESGVSLREDSVVRDDIDYERLARVAASLDLDVVALQEIGSPRAAARVFPESDYHIVMSDRYQPGDEDRAAAERDIFTALALSKETFPELPEVETLSAISIDHIGFDRDGTPSIRPTRAGLVGHYTYNGQKVKLLAIHLKSSCHRWKLDPVTDQSPTTGEPFRSRFDCRTLAAQRAILENWIEQQAAQDIGVIVLGDFNRELNTEGSTGAPIDEFWLDMNDGTPNSLTLFKGPEDLDTVCWPNHSRRFEQHIDLILWDDMIADLVSLGAPQKHSMGFEDDPRYAGEERQKLSDHCPVTMAISEAKP